MTNDVNVYAYYNEIQVEYKIYFNVDNENIEFIETAGNEILTLPSPPIKEGYTFKGWYFDNNIWNNELTTDYYANSKLSQDVTVYAYYEEDVILPTEYLVSFETNGGSPLNSITTSLIETSPFTTRDGYTFSGWFIDSQLTQIVSFPFEVTENMTLYAKWEQDEVKITYNLNDSNQITGISSAPDGELILNIPSQINGQTVVGIGNGAFKNNTNIVEVYLPDTITQIFGEAFFGCSNLQKIKLPNSLKMISYGTFSYCYALKQIELPNTLQSIGSDAFRYSGLTEISLPDSIKSISQYAFEKNANLKTVNLNKVETIGTGAFMDCPKIEKITVPETVKLMEHHVFTRCSALSQIEMLATDAIIYYSIIDDTAYFNNSENWIDGGLYLGNYFKCKMVTKTVNLQLKTGQRFYLTSHSMNKALKQLYQTLFYQTHCT